MGCQMCITANHSHWSKFDIFGWSRLLRLRFMVFFIRFFWFFHRTRSFLCGIATANHYLVASIVTKSYYNIEVWLTLPGAILFYAVIGVIGYVCEMKSNTSLSRCNFTKLINLLALVFSRSLIVMYFILPETEQRSLEDIELHFSDNSKGFTDIYIHKASKSSANWNRPNLLTNFKYLLIFVVLIAINQDVGVFDTKASVFLHCFLNINGSGFSFRHSIVRIPIA